MPTVAKIAQETENTPEFLHDVIEGATLGDFSEKETYGAQAGKIIGGLNPAGDVRDVVANTKNVAQDKPGSYIGLGASVVGAIPIAGDIAKPIIKGEKKIITEVIEDALKTESKEVGEQAIKAVGKQTDEIAEVSFKQADDAAVQTVKITEANKQIAQIFPRGFDNVEQFSKAVDDIKLRVKVNDAAVGVRGSSVTGVKFKSGDAFDSASDIDFFVISDKLYAQGLEKGAKGTNGSFKVGATKKYFPEVHEVEKSLSEQLGRKLTIRIFNQEGFDAVKAGEEIVVK